MDFFRGIFAQSAWVIRPSYCEVMSDHGKDLGKGGAKRHHKVLHDNIQSITKRALRRLNQKYTYIMVYISGFIYGEICELVVC